MRTLRNLALAVTSVIVILLLFDAISHANMHYPSPENESAFLRAYSLKPVVKPFIDPAWGFGEGDNSGGGAGMGSVTHTAGFDEHFTIRSERKGTLMMAVDHDMEQWLHMSGARILTRTAHPLLVSTSDTL